MLPGRRLLEKAGMNMKKLFKMKGGEAYDCSLSRLLYHLSCPPLKRIRWFQMSEAIITRRGYGPNGKPELRTETITGSTTWVVPSAIRSNISVRIFGGGGGGNRGGGGGGWMNNGEFNIAGGTSIQITIGSGGNRNGGSSGGGTTGGTTSFGTWLSANGGEGDRGNNGGNGGSGGGGWGTGGGTGYQFGGGGSGSEISDGDKDYAAVCGNGGTWGGGGGAGCRYGYWGHGGHGGQYGGGGGGAAMYAGSGSGGRGSRW